MTDNLGSILHDAPDDSTKVLNYGKMIEVFPLEKEERNKVIGQITTLVILKKIIFPQISDPTHPMPLDYPFSKMGTPVLTFDYTL